MALSTADRQRIYREKITRGEIRQFQFDLPLETGIKADCLYEALQCNRSVLFSRLILAERKRQGEPSDRPSNGSQKRRLESITEAIYEIEKPTEFMR